MTAHKHAEMIKAKADNMELVVFFKLPGEEWWQIDGSQLPDDDEISYFLCLPQHKEACLHWLNGGEVQTRNSYSDLGWDTLLPFEDRWTKVSHFMCVDILLRIKPRKEKRWIAINVKDGDVCLCTENSAAAPNYQIVEIEVEV